MIEHVSDDHADHAVVVRGVPLQFFMQERMPRHWDKISGLHGRIIAGPVRRQHTFRARYGSHPHAICDVAFDGVEAIAIVAPEHCLKAGLVQGLDFTAVTGGPLLIGSARYPAT